MRNTFRRRWDSSKFEFTKEVIEFRLPSFAFEHFNHHGRLVVNSSRETTETSLEKESVKKMMAYIWLFFVGITVFRLIIGANTPPVTSIPRVRELISSKVILSIWPLRPDKMAP